MSPTPRVFFLPALRLLVFAALAACGQLAWADDYGDVSGLIRSGKLGEALAKADQYLATRPRDPQMRFLKGVAQTDAGRTADAIATVTALNADYPELPEPYNNLAVLYAAQAQFDKARVALEAAVRANPDYAVAHENLGDVYARLAAREYARTQQLDAANTSVAPKLALIRQLFPVPGAARAQSGTPGSGTGPAPPKASAPGG